jgi:hypothetical protein
VTRVAGRLQRRIWIGRPRRARSRRGHPQAKAAAVLSPRKRQVRRRSAMPCVPSLRTPGAPFAQDSRVIYPGCRGGGGAVGRPRGRAQTRSARRRRDQGCRETAATYLDRETASSTVPEGAPTSESRRRSLPAEAPGNARHAAARPAEAEATHAMPPFSPCGSARQRTQSRRSPRGAPGNARKACEPRVIDAADMRDSGWRALRARSALHATGKGALRPRSGRCAQGRVHCDLRSARRAQRKGALRPRSALRAQRKGALRPRSALRARKGAPLRPRSALRAQ